MNYFAETNRPIHEFLMSKFEMTPDTMTSEKALSIDFLVFALVCFVAIISYFLIKKVVQRIVQKAVKKTQNSWDNELLKSKIFTWVSLMVPTVIIWKFGKRAFLNDNYSAVIHSFGALATVILGFLALNSLLNIAERIYRRFEISRKFPIRGFIQVVKIILSICAGIFVISIVIGKSPLTLFAGLGAMSAVLMFIFKDSILGLVAGIQLSANQMVACGDWIEVPKFGADGEVLDVALTTVKVRNWDKTITTLPTYALISDSFKNWRGMSQSNVRRIKRSLCIDLQTVKFVDDSLLAKFKEISLLKDYITEKEREVDSWNAERSFNKDNVANARVLTNIGTFRAYVVAYLRNHAQIAQDETVLVRQLQPTEYGLPIEIYVFSKDNRWVEFEAIQSDIFDHFFSVLPEFDLKVFQRPSGSNFTVAE